MSSTSREVNIALPLGALQWLVVVLKEKSQDAEAKPIERSLAVQIATQIERQLPK